METKIDYIWLKGDQAFQNIGRMTNQDSVSITKQVFSHLFEFDIIGDDEDEAGKFLGDIFKELDLKPRKVARNIFKIKTESAKLTKDINRKLGEALCELRIIAMIDDCPNCGREREYFEDADIGGPAYSVKRCRHCKEDWQGDIEEGPTGLYGKFY